LGGCWLESAGEAVEVGAGELPLERGGDLLVAAADLEQGALKGVEVGEVAGGAGRSRAPRPGGWAPIVIIPPVVDGMWREEL
jgi:hypothetical protein